MVQVETAVSERDNTGSPASATQLNPQESDSQDLPASFLPSQPVDVTQERMASQLVAREVQVSEQEDRSAARALANPTSHPVAWQEGEYTFEVSCSWRHASATKSHCNDAFS